MRTEKIKVLNLYAGIGGNRKLWVKPHINQDIEVTAVEIEPKIAKIYQDFFPNDKVIVTDAHQFLLEHFEEFDFIWSSPPCPSHSRIRNIAGVGSSSVKPIFPDMKLWEEIIFLNQIWHTSGTNFNGKFCVENVITYYKPLIHPQKSRRHYFWCNFIISPLKSKDTIITASLEQKQKRLEFNFEHENEKQILNNCVEPELGLHIFNMAFKDKQKSLNEL